MCTMVMFSMQQKHVYDLRKYFMIDKMWMCGKTQACYLDTEPERMFMIAFFKINTLDN